MSPNIHAYLSTISAVVAIVDSRVYPLQIPQHTYKETTKQPCLVYQKVGATRGKTFCASDDLVGSIYQIDCYARKHVTAQELADAVKTAMIDYSGSMGDAHVSRVFLDNEFELLDPEPGLYRVSQTYSIWYVDE